jgi:hypothetical protein
MVEVVEPQLLGEPDRLRADRDHRDLEIERLPAGRDQDHPAQPQQREAERIDAEDQRQPALAHHHALADIKLRHQAFGAGIRDPYRAQHARKIQHANHNTTLWLDEDGAKLSINNSHSQARTNPDREGRAALLLGRNRAKVRRQTNDTVGRRSAGEAHV